MDVTSTARAPRAAHVGLALAVASTAWLFVALAVPGLPAWPGVSAGMGALSCVRVPGGPLARGLGAFLALIGTVGGALQIGLYWATLAVLSALPGTAPH